MNLLDTCVISHLRPGQSRPNRDIGAWLRHRSATAKASRLQAGYEEIIGFHAERILPIDVDVAIRADALMAKARSAGAEPAAEDAWIAATAEIHGMEVLTFNMADFHPMMIACRNPVTGLPADRSD